MNKIKIAKQLVSLAKQLVQSNNNLMNAINIKRQLEKIHIQEYLPFRKIHAGSWMSFPINRNSKLPDIYVNFNDGKVQAGYNYIDNNEIDYHSPEQESISGLIEELAIIKKMIGEIVINIKNDDLTERENTDTENPDEEIVEDETSTDVDVLDEEMIEEDTEQETVEETEKHEAW